MDADLVGNSQHNRTEDLAPIPTIGAAATEFLQQISGKRVIARAWNQVFQHPCRNGWRLTASHMRSPFISGNSPHSSDSTRRVACTWRKPAFVNWKYLFALPPRAGVGSPRLEETRPLPSSRSSAAYTLPTETSRGRCLSSSREMGTP